MSLCWLRDPFRLRPWLQIRGKSSSACHIWSTSWREERGSIASAMFCTGQASQHLQWIYRLKGLKGSQGTPESWRSSQFTAGRSDWPRSAQGSAQVKQEGVIPGLQAAGLTNSDHFLEISDHFLTSRPNHLSSSKIVPFPLQFWLKLLPFHHLHKG